MNLRRNPKHFEEWLDHYWPGLSEQDRSVLLEAYLEACAAVVDELDIPDEGDAGCGT